MWTDANGYEHYGRPPHEDRGWQQLKANMTIEEKYKQNVEEACRWLDRILFSNPYKKSDVILHPLIACKSKKEIIDDFREMMKIT